MLTLFSPAKINIFFKLIDKRADGYHNLQSLFQAINLGDTLSLEVSAADSYECNDKTLAFTPNNLIHKAFTLFREKTGINHPVRITLQKNIPIMAGLGGGSGNAATMLWGLNKLFDFPLTPKELFEFSTQLGSDVPFFFSLGTALCEGRGEIVTNLKPLEKKKLWLVKPEESLSTKEVYTFSKVNKSITHNLQVLIDKAYSKKPDFKNDLEEAAFLLSPRLSLLKEALIRQGYESVFMTGSGTGLICVGDKKPFCKNPVQIYPISYINRSPNEWYK